MSRLSLSKLWKRYGEHVVLEAIDLDVASGEFVAIVGPSGCGKSTLLRLLLGEEQPSRGSIRLDDRPLVCEPDAARGIVFQRYSVFPHLCALDNVLLGLEFGADRLLGRVFGRRRRALRERARAMLAEVGLADAAARYPSELSGGMQQRLALAQSLITEPGILLLDEPFGALDPGIRADMHELVGRLWRTQHLTVFMITHDIREAFVLGTRLVVLDKRRHDPHAP
jgi:NitT/TauT family transport system ATP-binding protein